MPFLDARTIFISMLLSNILFIGLLWQVWRQNRHRFAGTDGWLSSAIMQTTALGLFIVQEGWPNRFLLVAANCMILWSVQLWYRGLERFVGRRSAMRRHYALLAAFTAVHAYYTRYRASELILSARPVSAVRTGSK